MNSVQVHLALTHVPVVLSLVGLVMLVVALIIKNTTLTKTSYIMIFIAGIAAIPVYFTGEGAEEAIEKLPGISESVIESHEDAGKMAMIAISAAGLAALAALLSIKRQAASRIGKILVLLLTITSGVLMVQTAHLGGQIRHPEITAGFTAQNNNEPGENHSPVHAAVPLNNGVKWEADAPTRTNVAALVRIINDPAYTDAKQRNQLYTNLQVQLDTLVRQCRMQGPAHDALHVWLEKVMSDVKELKDEEHEYSKVYSMLKSDVESFYQTFE